MSKFFLFLASVLISSCSTYSWKVRVNQQYLENKRSKLKEIVDEKNDEIESRHKNDPKVKQANRENQKLKINVDQVDLANHFLVRNNYDFPITFNFSKSYMLSNGMSSRVISGETSKIMSSLSSPDVVIAPNSAAQISLYNPQNIQGSSSYDEVYLNFSVKNKSVGYRHIRKPYSVTLPEIDYDFIVRTPISEGRNLCYITGILYGGTCWFLSPGKKDEELAKDKAIETRKVKDGEFTLEYSGKDF